MIKAIPRAMTITSSIATALELTMLARRVEASTSKTWTSNTTMVITRAVVSSGRMSKRGMSAVLARASSTPTTAIAR